MVGSKCYGRVVNRLGVMDCSSALVVYGEAFTNMSFFCYHEIVRENVSMWEGGETHAVIHGRVRKR